MEDNQVSSTQPTNQNPGGNRGLLTAIVVVLIVLIGGYFLFANNGEDNSQVENTNTQQSSQSEENTVTPSQSETNSGSMMSGEAKTFTFTNQGFAFNPNEIRVKKGDKVKVTYTSQGGTHDWVVDEFNARTKVLAAGASETIEFTVDKTGTFEFYCSVGNHRAMGMKGKLIVE
jgi:plastocyanin